MTILVYLVLEIVRCEARGGPTISTALVREDCLHSVLRWPSLPSGGPIQDPFFSAGPGKRVFLIVHAQPGTGPCLCSRFRDRDCKALRKRGVAYSLNCKRVICREPAKTLSGARQNWHEIA